MPPKSNVSRKRRKPATARPAKPYRDFPLTAHPNGYWCKSILGTVHYFGRWGRVRKGKMERVPGDGWKEALELYTSQRDDLFAGRKPRDDTDGLTIKDLCNRFLTSKQRQFEGGEIVWQTFADYRNVTDRIVSRFGKLRLVEDLTPHDFEEFRAEVSRTRGPVSLGNTITRTRVVFNFAYNNALIDAPVRYGSAFKRPSMKVLRKARNSRGPIPPRPRGASE